MRTFRIWSLKQWINICVLRLPKDANFFIKIFPKQLIVQQKNPSNAYSMRRRRFKTINASIRVRRVSAAQRRIDKRRERRVDQLVRQ